ncbi:hypothetical protein E05_33890 [Plautia stali symbiont]|nr:hypothetical protein E05_33890 [Plautia stali symbiont]
MLVTESRQVDNTTNILRLMMLLALAIGIILTRIPCCATAAPAGSNHRSC